MSLVLKDLPEILRSFFQELEADRKLKTAMSRGDWHFSKIATGDIATKNNFLMCLEIYGPVLPNDPAGISPRPDGFSARLLILQLADRIITSAGISLFVGMLAWDWVINDPEYSTFVLGVIRKYGMAQHAPLIHQFVAKANDLVQHDRRYKKIQKDAHATASVCTDRGYGIHNTEEISKTYGFVNS